MVETEKNKCSGGGIGIRATLKMLFAVRRVQVQILLGAHNWGISLVGRALDLHSKGQEFDSPILHNMPEWRKDDSLWVVNIKTSRNSRKVQY